MCHSIELDRHHTKECDSWRKQIRENLREAVLDAQELLHARGILKPELLAELSQKFSVELVEAAEVFGIYDAVHAVDLKKLKKSLVVKDEIQSPLTSRACLASS